MGWICIYGRGRRFMKRELNPHLPQSKSQQICVMCTEKIKDSLNMEVNVNGNNSKDSKRLLVGSKSQSWRRVEQGRFIMLFDLLLSREAVWYGAYKPGPRFWISALTTVDSVLSMPQCPFSNSNNNNNNN